MKKAYISTLLLAGSCMALGFVACGGSSNEGASGAGGAAATGGSTAGTTGGATSLTPTGGKTSVAGGSTAMGGSKVTAGATSTSPGGSTSSTGGSTSAGGASSVSIQQACAAECAAMASRADPLPCVPADCEGTCNSTYTTLIAAKAVCGDDYLALLRCGITQPADTWTCFTVSAGTTSISIPVPPSSLATDPCYSQFQALYLTMLQNLQTCAMALSTTP